jgi:hypothetical protein
MRSSIQNYTSILEETALTTRESEGEDQTVGLPKPRKRQNLPIKSRVVSSNRQVACLVITDTWLRTFGFYGSFSFKWCDNRLHKSRVSVGYKFPSWLLAKSINLGFEISSTVLGEGGLQVDSGYLRLQNQVPEDSPFMLACRRGDLDAIRQHLADRTGHVGDRTMTHGNTPLLVCPCRDKLR